ncbi:molybdopterin molybdotransferase MoeA [Rufibacter tibetensis]|uniref:Molybdopterin molybdenumtransferase n=1 Tax=Rufibacter tibetensis TaxID=512763 RepID=A0A0P0CV31_9BACT|nr:molybdopterin molybdotransferase MoeA [Rufibacter tibetensis]ALJ00523.1 hypothetical protein DC20_18045 [Rufibacter tibetensis]
MISAEEALQLVRQYKVTLEVEEVALLKSLHRVLAQEVKADRDFPPFDRVTMDGIAIRAEDFLSGLRSFPIAQLQAAGAPQTSLDQAGTCIEIMTGAMLPRNANAVVPYEVCIIQDGIATIQAEQVVKGQNIHVQGSDEKVGATLIAAGTKITPAMIGTLASVGLSRVQVYSLPKIAICSTGDELVEVHETPLPHQIRRSNAYMLAAALLEEHLQANLFHLPDHPELMHENLSSIIQEHDVVLLSGAVSKGKFDFLPHVLEQLGLELVFHKIAQKPGKPMLFGTLPAGKIVFGFPGNPVSTFVCYHLYFRAWLQASLGLPPQQQSAQLAQPITYKPALTYHVPVVLRNEEGILKAIPVSTTGSGDLTSILKAKALLSLPTNKTEFKEDEWYPLTLL